MPTLHWVGKDKVVNHHHDVPFRLLDKQYSFTADENAPPNSIDNRIIHGDNLEALKSLLPELEGKVNCIYIDPPYNTGNEGWVYNDNVNDPKIKKWLGQVVGKEGEDLSRHDKWLCMMYPRLKLLHRLLAEDGVIFISIDDNETHTLRLMLDEIWGRSNFISTVIWQKVYAPKNSTKHFSEDHDFIAIYAKNSLNWMPHLLPRTDAQNAVYKNPDNDPRGLWRPNNLAARNFYSKGMYSIVCPSGRVIGGPPKGSYWRISEERFKELDADNRIWWGETGNNIPAPKIFLTEVNAGRVPQTFWPYTEVGHTQDAKKELLSILNFERSEDVFITPKPSTLIDRILQLATKKDSIILDSFAGSGTTAHAVLKLNAQDGGNRRFILCEMMDYAETITAERVRRVIQGYGEGQKATAGTGGGFDYYTVGAALFKEDKNLNEDVGEIAIRDYVAYTENIPSAAKCVSKKGIDSQHIAQRVSPHALGVTDTVLWVFYYQRDDITTLGMDFLTQLNIKALRDSGHPRPQHFVIYADKCALEPEFLRKHGVTFKRIPRDITRF